MGEKPVGEGEDLTPLSGAVAGVRLGLPGAVQDVGQPRAGLLGVDDRLSEGEIREPVGPHDPGLVVLRPVAHGRGYGWWHLVLAPVDGHPTVGGIGARLLGGVGVGVRLVRQRRHHGKRSSDQHQHGENHERPPTTRHGHHSSRMIRRNDG